MKRQILLLIFGTFIGYTRGVTQDLPNGGFENFGSQVTNIYLRQNLQRNPGKCMNEPSTFQLKDPPLQGRDRPLGFKTSDDILLRQDAFYVVQETAAEHVRSGSSALRLQDNSFGLGVVGFFEAEELVWETLPTPYLFDDVPIAIEGYYKHTSGTPQTFAQNVCTSRGPLTEATTFFGGFAVYALMTKYNTSTNQRDTVAFVNEVFDDASTYTAFSVPIDIRMEDVLPDSILFVLSCSPEFLSPNAIVFPGSTSVIDDLDFVFCDPLIDNTVNLSARTLVSNDANADSYQWIDCDNSNTPIEGATERTFSAEENGNYAVIITNGSCSETSACTFVDITSCNSSSTQNAEACFEYTWLGNTYSETGTYTTTLPNSLGCDSLLTLNLTIDTVNTAITQAEGTLTSQQANATYQWLDCDNDNVPVEDATSSSFTPGSSGRYAVEITTADGCTGTTECVTIEVILGIEENNFGHPLAIYPNPSNGLITIDLGEVYPTVEITVSDLSGKIHLVTTGNNMRQANLPLDVPPGTYLVTLRSTTGPTAHARIIIN